MGKIKNWTKVPWGNPDLNHWCWRKSFRRGHVSVGIGEFTLIVFSYGTNSPDSFSSTRWRKWGCITEEEAMRLVDKNNGYDCEEESKLHNDRA